MDSLKSKMGTFWSIVFLITLITYTGYKIDIVVSKKSDTII